MSLEETLQEFAQAERHIDEFERRVAAQQALVAEFERAGYPKQLTRSLLREFQESLRIAHEHRERLLREFRRLDPGHPK